MIVWPLYSFKFRILFFSEADGYLNDLHCEAGGMFMYGYIYKYLPFYMCVLIYDSCVYDYKAFSSLERDWMMEFLEDLVLASIRSGGFIFSMTAFVHMEFSSVCWSPSKSLHTLCAYFLS